MGSSFDPWDAPVSCAIFVRMNEISWPRWERLQRRARWAALAGASLLLIPGGCQTDADLVCERLADCGCLSESVDTCAERLDGESHAAVARCADCLAGHDYMCHELGASHAVCGGCTDDFASSDRARDTDTDTITYPVVDQRAPCLEVEPSP